MKEIKSLDIMSTGKLYAGVCAFLYGIIAIVYGLVLIGILATRGIAFMILGLIGSIVAGLIAGFIIGIISAWIYNIVAKKIGGIKIDLK